MGTANISFGKVGVGGGQGFLPTLFTPEATENLTTSTTSAPSVGAATAVGNKYQNAVRIVIDEDAYVRIGEGTPVAIVGDPLIKANVETYLAIPAGHRIAVKDVA